MHDRIGGATCPEPNERAVVLHPETEQIFTFIVQRRSQARDGMPPLAYQYPGLLSAEEHNRLLQGLALYKEYLVALEAVEEDLADWVLERYGTGDTPKAMAADEGGDIPSCPEGTALHALTDAEEWPETLARAEESIIEEFEQRFDEGTDWVVSRQWFQVGGGPLPGSYTFRADAQHSGEIEESFRVRYFMREASDSDFEVFDHGEEDYLVFEFSVTRDFATGRIMRPELKLNENLSRIHGRVGFLTDGGPDLSPENLDRCSFERVKEALRTGVISGSGSSSGGGGSGFRLVRINAGTPTVTIWFCGSGTCCKKSSGPCVPAGEIISE